MSLYSSGCARLAAKGRRKRARPFGPEYRGLEGYWRGVARIERDSSVQRLMVAQERYGPLDASELGTV